MFAFLSRKRQLILLIGLLFVYLSAAEYWASKKADNFLVADRFVFAR